MRGYRRTGRQMRIRLSAPSSSRDDQTQRTSTSVNTAHLALVILVRQRVAAGRHARLSEQERHPLEACDGSRRGCAICSELRLTRIFARSGPRRWPGALCPAQCLPPPTRRGRIGTRLATCVHYPSRTRPSLQTTPSWPGTPRVQRQADSVEVSRLGAKTRLPACTRRVGWPYQSLFTFDPCDWSEPMRPPTIWIADSVLLKASFCGVLGLECVRSWRRGNAGAEREWSLLVAAIWPAQNHRAVPAGLSANHRTVRRPHLTGCAKRCTGSLSTIPPVDRPELIFAVESQYSQPHAGSTPAEGPDAGYLRSAVTARPF